MNIQLISTKAVAIDLSPLEDILEGDMENETDFSFDFNPVFDDNLEFANKFLVAYFGEMRSYKEQFECKVVYIAEFEVDEPITSDFLKGNFALINAPAIGYPYFRAFYSNFLLNAGYEPKILPTINFVQLRDDKLKEMDKHPEE